MYARMHAKSDILNNGKIMLTDDSSANCYILSDLQYAEYAFKELLVDTEKTRQQLLTAKEDMPLDQYMPALIALTNNLKTITDSLLTIKKQEPCSASQTVDAAAFSKKTAAARSIS